MDRELGRGVPSDRVVTLNVEDGIGLLVLNRPDDGNPIDIAFIDAFEEATCACGDDKSVRAVLISARGRRFSVGGDIRGFTENRDELAGKIRKWNASLNGSVARLHRGNAPTVAAVHDVVAGGALSIISGCDIIVASETARFVAAYANIGYCPDLGGTINLVRRMGLARARRFHLLHETLDARQALDSGLVDVVVPKDQVLERAEEIARKWAAGPTLAYGEIRRLMQDAHAATLETQLEAETRSLVSLVQTEDAWEALTAFLGKRTPQYSGR